jgi:RNA polymerase sigma-70 factor (sigma-E family)
VQDALARTHRAWRRLAAGGNPEAYARQVMYHLQVSRWRRRCVAESLPGDLPERGDRRDPAGEAADRLALRKALLSLPARQRSALVLRYFEDHSEAEAAEILGCRVGTVKSHTARGLAALRRALPDFVTEGLR